jgi:adenine-specific DNA-methyltransferase
MGFRYIGSKDKLSDVIIAEIKAINENATHIIDLMAGTGLFSLALRENNFTVLAADMMTYSYHHLTVQLLLNKAPAFANIKSLKNISNYGYNQTTDNYQAILNYLNDLPPIEGYFYKEFSPDGTPQNTTKPRKYFIPANASKIDAIRTEIKQLKRRDIITATEHSLLLHDLIMAVNDIANIAGTYGHYLSKFVTRAMSPILLNKSNFSDSENITGHQIFKGYAEDLAGKLQGDICYIDPPYMKRQYAANYHVLETLAREDEPEAAGDSGLRPWRDQYSNFCSKLKIRESFDKIITNVGTNDFLISYSEDGLLPINDLISFLSNYGTVQKKEIRYKRFKSNDSKKDTTLNEFLLHLHRN